MECRQMLYDVIMQYKEQTILTDQTTRQNNNQPNVLYTRMENGKDITALLFKAWCGVCVCVCPTLGYCIIFKKV